MRARPLPGIRIESQARTGRDALPRMDIPAFVGFAASGPIDCPVAVSDPSEFAMIFGDDVELPRPQGTRETRTAHLGPVVRAFFRHGGRRCWIVRVARTVATSPLGAAASANRFRIPGLSRVAWDGTLADAYTVARSEGSWSDALTVSTSLVTTALRVLNVDTLASPPFIDVAVTTSREVEVGDLVRAVWLNGSPSLYLFVTSVGDAPLSPQGSGARAVRLTGRTLSILNSVSSPLPASPPAGPSVERLTFDLTVRRPGRPPFAMRGLGFTPEHRRYFGALPTDLEFFRDITQFVEGAKPLFRPKARVTFGQNFLQSTAAPERAWPDLWREVFQPRFPLATPRDGAVYLPATMSALGSMEAFADPVAGTTLDRDGLAQFDSSLFIDRAFTDARVRDLIDRANAIRYQGSITRSLTGFHAALVVEEATMLAAPDAAHSGWLPDAPPQLESPPRSSPLLHPEWWRWLDCRSPLTSPPAIPLGAGFIACDLVDPIPAPLLTATAPAGGRFDLNWDTFAGSIDELEEATRPDFSDAAVISRDAPPFTVFGRSPGNYFYRVRRVVGDRTSDYSNGVGVPIAAVAGWVARDDYDDRYLLDIHRAMIRMCAARADWTAVLSLPSHYDERSSLAHVTKLITPEDAQTLSYGALWHPWLIGRDETGGPLRPTPPDGAITGVLAMRAIRRGAWVAPANEPLQGVVALTPRIVKGTLQALQDAAINIVRQEPSGFVTLDADTLTNDEMVRPLNVRRLLILVRRFALRVGNDYVFEPNSGVARRAVKRAFELMLETLFLRGAFAGRTAKTAFQVVTDETVNTARSVDQGQLLAEIRVAPSHPLSFLTVRLLRSGDVTTLEEIA